MSECKYTPGPWEVADGTRVGVTLPSLTEGVGYSSHCVAITHSSYGRLDAEANARLIAAAPELLEALRPFAAGNWTEELAKNARAALSKAGGQPSCLREGEA